MKNQKTLEERWEIIQDFLRKKIKDMLMSSCYLPVYGLDLVWATGLQRLANQTNEYLLEQSGRRI